MYEHKALQNLEEYFNDLSLRGNKKIYFYRINCYNETIKNFILKYYESSRLLGVVIEGKIPNPDEKNLSYYEEIMGMDFQMSMGFLTSSLKKWLPRMNNVQTNSVATSMYDTLDDMRQHEGKNDNMLKNTYIKFMCWLYYKFERILNQLGNESIPKILYEGEISNYELKLITILANSGCDVVLLQYHGDTNYLKLDATSKVSNEYRCSDGTSFPNDFNIKWIRKTIQDNMEVERLYGTLPQIMNCTNAWISGVIYEDILKDIQTRGSDSKLFYNCFCRICGVEDKLTYLNELYQFQLQLKNNKRRVVIVENEISQPTMEEIAGIKRSNYMNQEQMLLDLSKNIQYSANIELQRLMIKNFVDLIVEESKKSDSNLNKLTNQAVYILCWLRRYIADLFLNWKMPDVSCFIYLGSCKNESEVIFLKFLSRLPIDVLILIPDLNSQYLLKDTVLYDKKYSASLVVDKFPCENTDIHMGTAAFHAERELDTLMYQDSGIYRNRQYDKAIAVNLNTMYEEISILWDQELNYRPNFSVVDSVVSIPVIFSKISGVKEGNIAQYWQSIKTLITAETFVIKSIPCINGTDVNPVKGHTAEFLKNGKIQKNKIKLHSAYQYSFLREEMQDYILDKLQLLIDHKTIKGTFENGTEYTIVATVLNLNQAIVRMIQKFDFTKKNPKVIYINTTESIMSLEDSIMLAFLNLLGFDIIFFIPTGYQNIEKYFNEKTMEEHQIGDYIYDLHTPNFDTISSNTRPSWREIIFKRGN
ncbi:MAG: YceG family protein [Lachnotalea sp.]